MFPFVVGLAVVWGSCLLSLAIFTANPLLLNRDQVLRADGVVSATISRTDPASVSVTKEWKNHQLPRTLRLKSLLPLHLKPEHEYLIPISKVGSDTYAVTPTRLPDQPRLVYPVSRESVRQLREILSETVAKPGEH